MKTWRQRYHEDTDKLRRQLRGANERIKRILPIGSQFDVMGAWHKAEVRVHELKDENARLQYMLNLHKRNV